MLVFLINCIYLINTQNMEHTKLQHFIHFSCLPFVLHFFYLVQQLPVGQDCLSHDVFRSHTTTHHSRQESSGRVISSSQRPLPDSTHTYKRHPCRRRDSNQQSQQASGRRPASGTGLCYIYSPHLSSLIWSLRNS